MDSRKMKRGVCTPQTVLRSVGILLIVLGAVLAIFWPHIFDRLLARVGHGLAQRHLVLDVKL